MKKLILMLLLLVVLCGCQVINTSNTTNNNNKYIEYCKVLSEGTDFKDESEFFDISSDITAIDNGYRYYIIIDNAKLAMYKIKAVALEKGVDYLNNMAANVGVFEENEYSMIPGQTNIDENFVKGFSISGLTQNPNPTIYLLVEWSNKDQSITSREFLRVRVSSGENDE